ncbi:hypothetical protein DRO66_10985 [Candidatus Bathyarchaeota archaeon]|nr:MAG: hypothetical protein DRO66_10985 [Candidatus Bathyarchaeota archaeon]
MGGALTTRPHPNPGTLWGCCPLPEAVGDEDGNFKCVPRRNNGGLLWTRP